jgi:site-specific recombinase XerD
MLRHYFCSRLLEVGARIEAVRILAGHTKLSTTARSVHATTAEMNAAISPALWQLAGNGVGWPC